MSKQKSDVARLLTQINSEYEAAQRSLSGLAQGISQHQFMTKRMENIAGLHGELRGLVGDDAMELITEQLEASSFAPCASCDTPQKCEADGCPLPNNQRPTNGVSGCPDPTHCVFNGCQGKCGPMPPSATGGGNAELAAIADQLRETASYAIDPSFKERLRVELMEMMRC